MATQEERLKRALACSIAYSIDCGDSNPWYPPRLIEWARQIVGSLPITKPHHYVNIMARAIDMED